MSFSLIDGNTCPRCRICRPAMDDGGGKMPSVESGSEEASLPEESSLKAQGTAGMSEGRTCYQCRKSKVSAYC